MKFLTSYYIKLKEQPNTYIETTTQSVLGGFNLLALALTLKGSLVA